MRAFLVAALIFSAASFDLCASCCSSAATGGVGRLLRHERAMVELSTNTKLATGSFDKHAQFYRGTKPGSVYLALEPELAVVTRVFDLLEPFAKIPTRIQKSDERTGAHVADITLGARSPLLRENFFAGLPSVTMIASVRMPTGASMKQEPMLLIEDATGSGSYLISLSMMLEKELAHINFGAGYGFGFEPDHVRSVNYKPAFIHSPFLSAAFSPHDGGLLSCTWSMLMHTANNLDARPLIDTDKRKMTVAVAYSVGLHSHIKLNSQLGADVPFDYIGKNFQSEAFIKVGLRFGVF